MAKNNFHIISVISDNVSIWTEDGLTEKEAEKRYKELYDIGKTIENAKTLLFIIEGDIKKKTKEIENLD